MENINFAGLLSGSIKESIKSYSGNELAFHALQGKIELLLRDKIAWNLETKLSEYGYYVKKEYNPNPDRVKCDLAILDQDKKQKCLVEFKAAIWGEYQKKEYNNCCKDDCNKMRDFANGEEIPMYYVFFQIYHRVKEDSNLDPQLIAYIPAIKTEIKKIKGGLVPRNVTEWGDAYVNHSNNIKVYYQDIGEYYGVEVGIATMILEVSSMSR